MKIKDMTREQKCKVINFECPAGACGVCQLYLNNSAMHNKYSTDCVSLLLDSHPRLKIVREFNVNLRKLK